MLVPKKQGRELRSPPLLEVADSGHLRTARTPPSAKSPVSAARAASVVVIPTGIAIAPSSATLLAWARFIHRRAPRSSRGRASFTVERNAPRAGALHSPSEHDPRRP